MNKYWVIILITLGLVSCKEHNEAYYLSHPEALQKAIQSCPNQQPQGLSCEKLNEIGQRLGTLAYQLQANPQNFGVRILTLQQSIANQLVELNKGSATKEAQSLLQKNQAELVDLLAVVRWLEAPEG